MISICIPIYNYDARKLVQDLHKQAEQSGVEFEFILLDDMSSDEYKRRNESLTQLKNVIYKENSENIGLSRMRNKLGELANYPYLIMVDSDAIVSNPIFIQRYLVLCQPGVVAFGGCTYFDECPDKKYILRWKFGKKREEGVGRYYSCFNFLIDKKILEEYPFSDKLSCYGYEDNLFGAKLKHAGIEISFIDNPLLHPGLDTAEVYLKKLDYSLKNLLFIEPSLKKIGQEDSIRLLKTYYSLKRLHLTKLTRYIFRLFKNKCLQNLKGNNPRLFILDFYKLGRFCEVKASKVQ